MSNPVKFGRSTNPVDPARAGRVERTPAADNRRGPIPVSADQALRGEPGVQPPKKRKRAARSQIVIFFNFLFSLLVFVLLALGGLVWFGNKEFQSVGPLTEVTSYTVRPGATIGQVADGLDGRKIISNARVFEMGVRFHGEERSIKAGEYEFEPGQSMQQVMNTLVEGKTVTHNITIVEGMTVAKAFERIAANDVLAGEMPEALPPEGSLIADTVVFQRGTTRSEVVEKLLADQKALVEEIWAGRQEGLPIKDMNEFVTLASIVEKETGVPAERPQVAAVFINRLNQGMRLQSDPTIIYGLFGGAGKPSDRPIYKSDIEKPTPFNTYTIDGLPPSPIAVPGRASLEAVAHPAQTDALFFVADGTGGHVFATTLEEHNANVRRWREIEKQKTAESDAQAEPAASGNGN